jgi:hypothetical protein
MSERFSQIPDPHESLKLNHEDKERFKSLSKILKWEKIGRDADQEIRSEFVLTEEEFQKVKTQAIENKKTTEEWLKKLMGDRKPSINKLPPFMSEEENEARRQEVEDEVLSILPKNLRTKKIVAGLFEMGIVADFRMITENMYAKKYEPVSWEFLNALHEDIFPLCDKCFTTSQKGSGTATEKTKADPKYDSIYYLFELSNGTYISQRFKRNLIGKGGLDNVIQRPAALALFTNKIDGTNLEPGTYDSTQIDTVPQIGYDLNEFFLDSSALDGDFSKLNLPNPVEIIRKGKSRNFLVKDDITVKSISEGTSVFIDHHEGTEVNEILK